MLHVAETRKLAKLLAMLGSSHDGEALTAARKAQEMVKASGTTWQEVLGLENTNQDPAPDIPHHAVALELLKASAMLTAFERKFLQGIMAFQKLTDRQELTLKTIRAKVAVSQGGS